jgi:hypothetical protein
LSDPGLELIPTFVSRCPNLQSGGENYGFFGETTPTCRSMWSRVAAPSLNPNGGMVWHRKISTSYNPVSCHPATATRRVDGCEPPAVLCQVPHPTTPPMRDDCVDVSEAKLSRSSILHRVGRYGDQHPDPRGGGPRSWGRSKFWFSLVPLREGVYITWVSLLELTFI